MTSPDKQAVPEDNQGASADADRAATASQPSQQAVSGIAGIPSAGAAPEYEVRIHGFHSEIYMDGQCKEILSWDSDGSRARKLVGMWERYA